MQVVTGGRCATCGQVLASDTTVCPSCGASKDEPLRRPRFTFTLLIALLVAGFTVTGFIVRAFDSRRDQLAERWFQRGNRDLQSGAALQAIDEYQTALAYSRDNDTYRMKLALALMQAGKWEEARAHLLNIWEQRPGDGEVNLLLARVFSRRNLPSNAIRYYHGAIYGVWDEDPAGSRMRARFELVDYLLSLSRKDAAQAELIALAAEAPTAVPDQLRLAQLMLKADEPERALDIFQQIRRKIRDNFDATLGAADAEFRLHRFANAAELAKEAGAINPASDRAAELRTESDALIAADPRVRGIGAKERAQRAFAAFQAASNRIVSCAAANPGDTKLQQLIVEQQARFQERRPVSLRDPDMRDEVMRWVFDVETATAKTCGAASGLDGTLLTLAQTQEKER